MEVSVVGTSTPPTTPLERPSPMGLDKLSVLGGIISITAVVDAYDEDRWNNLLAGRWCVRLVPMQDGC